MLVGRADDMKDIPRSHKAARENQLLRIVLLSPQRHCGDILHQCIFVEFTTQWFLIS